MPLSRPGALSGHGHPGVVSSAAHLPVGRWWARSLGLLAKGMAVPWDSL